MPFPPYTIQKTPALEGEKVECVTSGPKEKVHIAFFSPLVPLCQGNIKTPQLRVAVSWFYEVILNLFKSRLQVNAFNITHVEMVSSFVYAISTPPHTTSCLQHSIVMALACCAAFSAIYLCVCVCPKLCKHRRLGHQVIPPLAGPLAFPAGWVVCDPRLYFDTIFLSTRHCPIFK